MLFTTEKYVNRRNALRAQLASGIILLPGNNDSPYNYPSNTYKFRQDSTFLYYFGQQRNGLLGILDIEQGIDTLAGDEIDIDDIVWYGAVNSVQHMGEACGATHTCSMQSAADIITQAMAQGRRIHFLPPYRHDIQILLQEWLSIPPSAQRAKASVPLIEAVIAQRSIKDADEIAELERAAIIGYQMHTTAMRLCRPGVTERYIGGILEGIAASLGAGVSFQNIVSMHGEILHGYPSDKQLIAGRLMLCDAGAETIHHYCSDNTRTTPISGHFTQQQKDIYNIVVACHDWAQANAAPGVRYLDVHLGVCRLMVEGLKELGLMQGDTDEAVAAGAHALFMPHGLGHMMGMDVHDMEGLGQTHVGYAHELSPSTQFGLNSLRFARQLQEGFVVTDEPGIYFIPALIDLWQKQGTNAAFINFKALQTYRDFGGIRIEDDLLITATGANYIGEQRIPYYIDEVEAFLSAVREESLP